MRVATWNLQRPKPGSWKKRPPIEAKIREIGADVWILTETHECIRPYGCTEFAQSEFVDGLHEAGESRVTIWSRLPIRRRRETFDPKRTTCIEIECLSQHWIVVGTVIPYLAYGGTAHDESIRQHCAEWQQLTRESADARVVVAGDFNESLGTGEDAYHYGTKNGRQLLRHGLLDAGLECLTSDIEIEGLNGKQASIDHICLDSDSALNAGEPIPWDRFTDDGVEMSDHIGIYVDIE